MSAQETLRSGAQALGIALNEEQLAMFGQYAGLLEDWNSRINLTAVAPEDYAALHFLDSLTALRHIPITPGLKIVDVGTGAGFPGVALKITRPDLHITLVDSVDKKLNFIRHAGEQLQLELNFVHARAEALGREAAHRERYDIAIARAVAELPVLVELLLPLVKVGGIAIAMKGQRKEDEIEAAAAIISELGGQLDCISTARIPGREDARTIIMIKKVGRTPAKFPRSPAQLKRRKV